MSTISNILMLNKIHDGEELLVAVREMDQTCAVGRGHIGIGRAVSRLALTVGLRCFRAFLALGSALALSAGAAVAEGEWFLFIDADSYLSPETLRAMLSLIVSYPPSP